MTLESRLRWWLQRALQTFAPTAVDLPLLLALLALSGLSLAVVWSAGGQDPDMVWKQAARFGLGFVLLAVCMRIPPGTWRRWTPWFYALCLLLLLAVLLLGEGKGAQRWLNLGFLRFQPSELCKLGLPMMLAWHFHERVLPPSPSALFTALVLIALPAALIVVQPDLGTAVLVVGSGLFVIFLAGLSWWWIAGIGALAGASLPVLWQFMHDYQKQRVYQFLAPDSDPLGSGWQTIQSKIAVGSGGWSGKGWTHGTQSQLEFLPERHTDFVLAVYSEEFGWIGVALLMLVYAFVVGRALWIAANARDGYSRLLGGAIAMTFFVYVFVNSAMITGLMPVKGVPLPLISYGGTSAVSLLVAFGILMSIHAHRRA
ncbi:MAG: rod shape-determining protein RodA [Xanthomonadales bacterium]|nr:Peptidoglycan glycosyltransferase MrdB [Xanthomonadales bacterium]MCC6594168.1 rod shape-determining protein RodA [Xanthomonadales bacterium]MCE7931863.1 rod shape-determining protein RodA [Xanthomonadales bacterium PRO6]